MSYDPNQPRDYHGQWGPGNPSTDKFVRSPWEYDKKNKSLSGLGVKASLSESFTKEEAQALKDWSLMHFDPVNQFLRGQDPNSVSWVHKIIDGLNGAMRKSTLDSSIQVYRSMDGDFVNKIPINTKFRDLGFTATTELESVAKRFGWKDPVVFKIDIPKGYKAVPTRAFSNSPHQEEILINRGTRFIRTGKDQLKIIS